MQNRKPYSQLGDSLLYALIILLWAFICWNLLPTFYKPTYLFYVVVLFISLILIRISESVKYGRFWFYWLGILVLAAPLSFRDQMGIDDISYLRIYTGANNNGVVDYFKEFRVENGYLFLNWILYRLFGASGYNNAQICINSLTFIFWGAAFNKMGGKVSKTIMALVLWTHFYFFLLSAGLVRIFMAVPIVLYSLSYLWEQKPVHFIICIIIASTFHLSALLMLLFLICFWNRKLLTRNWIMYVFLFALGISASFIFVALFFAPFLGEGYDDYSQINSMTISLGAFDVLPILAISAFCYNRRNFQTEEENIRYVIGILLLSMSVIIGLASTMVALGRTVFYSNLGILLFCSIAFPHKSISSIYKVVLTIYLLFYVSYTSLFNPSVFSTIFPYVSFIGLNF